MRVLTFRGGIHPNDSKDATRRLSIRALSAPEMLIFPMLQHTGAQCVPLVKPGDYVKMGQKIGDSDAYISAPVHSSVSGEVIAVEPRLTPSGAMVNSVVIKNDFKDELSEEIKPCRDYGSLNREMIARLVREAGVVGMGGAGFPTHVKLTPPEGKVIDTVIVNGAECEPYLTSDHRVMLEEPEDIIDGLGVILHAFKTENGIIAIEDNKPDAIKTIEEKIAGLEGIRVASLRTKYPQGSEKQLIFALTGREVPSKGLPADVGVIVINIDTCTAIARKIKTGMPLIRRIVTVAGSAVKKPCNLSVRIGTPFKFLIEEASGFSQEPAKIVMGGPMMGIAVTSLEVPVVKGTSAILVFSKEDVAIADESNCIRCARCVEACPMNLVPLFIDQRVRSGDYEECERLCALDCIECGCCSYVCPARRHLTQSMRLAKQMIAANRKK